jgi:hypothetical protein
MHAALSEDLAQHKRARWLTPAIFAILRGTSRNMEAPQFAEKAIVYMRDMIPSTSNILKIPQRGPFQILEIKERNVVLLDPETGQTVNTHLE